MPFSKGTSGNPNGRPPRAKNKISAKIRDHFQMFLEDNLERIREDFDSLTPEQRIKYSIEIAKFCVPTLKSIELEQTPDNFQPIEIIMTNEN